MTLIELPDDIANRLNELAAQQDASVGELIERMLSRYTQPSSGSLAEMAQNAREANLASVEPVDTAANSREILNNEYADTLKQRIDDDDHHG